MENEVVDTTVPVKEKEYFEKVTDKLPDEQGDYITNFGSLEFDGTTFRMNGDRRHPTTVEWWLTPYKP